MKRQRKLPVNGLTLAGFALGLAIEHDQFRGLRQRTLLLPRVWKIVRKLKTNESSNSRIS